MDRTETDLWRRIGRLLGWTRSSYVLLSLFVAMLFLIGVVWWPLLRQELALIDWDRPLWGQIDWLLAFNFVVMSLLIMGGADLKSDVYIAFVSLCGGLAIESWGTQTGLWTYYTLERPPLWILPAWPVAFLSVDRLARLLRRAIDHLVPTPHRALFPTLYWAIFAFFSALLIVFVWPTLGTSLTLMALLLCVLLIATPTDYRMAVLTFAAGTGLGYFLELWGTTRLCWTYYTEQTPPLFAVLAHGMASVAFWRTGLLIRKLQTRWFARA